MMRIIDYKVVRNTSIFDLRDEVLQLAFLGWEPLGGICVTQMKSEAVIVGQAMIKREGEE
jgi:hypothetical protein